MLAASDERDHGLSPPQPTLLGLSAGPGVRRSSFPGRVFRTSGPGRGPQAGPGCTKESFPGPSRRTFWSWSWSWPWSWSWSDSRGGTESTNGAFSRRCASFIWSVCAQRRTRRTTTGVRGRRGRTSGPARAAEPMSASPEETRQMLPLHWTRIPAEWLLILTRPPLARVCL